VVHAYNPSTVRLRQKDQEFEARLRYTAKPCLIKQNKTPLLKLGNEYMKILLFNTLVISVLWYMFGISHNRGFKRH
jgi:hypothetical protein